MSKEVNSIYGFFKNGSYKLTMSSENIEERNVGLNILNFCLVNKNNIGELNEIFDRIILVSNHTTTNPNSCQIKKCIKYIKDNISGNGPITWQDLLWKSLGSLEYYKNYFGVLQYMIDYSSHIDSESVRFLYIINLDKNILEIIDKAIGKKLILQLDILHMYDFHKILKVVPIENIKTICSITNKDKSKNMSNLDLILEIVKKCEPISIDKISELFNFKSNSMLIVIKHLIDSNLLSVCDIHGNCRKNYCLHKGSYVKIKEVDYSPNEKTNLTIKEEILSYECEEDLTKTDSNLLHIIKEFGIINIKKLMNITKYNKQNLMKKLRSLNELGYIVWCDKSGFTFTFWEQYNSFLRNNKLFVTINPNLGEKSQLKHINWLCLISKIGPVTTTELCKLVNLARSTVYYHIRPFLENEKLVYCDELGNREIKTGCSGKNVYIRVS